MMINLMKKQHPITYEHFSWFLLALFIIFVVGSAITQWIGWAEVQKEVDTPPEVGSKLKEQIARCGGYPANDPRSDCPFVLQDNSYAGWRMGCNYARGTDADWHEETQSYGTQGYLSCANGLEYGRVKSNGEFIR